MYECVVRLKLSSRFAWGLNDISGEEEPHVVATTHPSKKQERKKIYVPCFYSVEYSATSGCHVRQGMVIFTNFTLELIADKI